MRKLPFLTEQILLSGEEVSIPWCFIFPTLHCFLFSPPLLPLNFSRYLTSKYQKGAWHYKALELHEIFREMFEDHKSIAHVQMTLFQSSVTVHLDHTHDHYWFTSDVHTRLLLLTHVWWIAVLQRNWIIWRLFLGKVLTACHVLSAIFHQLFITWNPYLGSSSYSSKNGIMQLVP